MTLCGILASLCFATDSSIPKILIVQNDSHGLLNAPVEDSTKASKKLEDAKKALKSDPDISETLAESIAENGRAEPIVWSQLDPIFRAAYQSNKLHWIGGHVSLQQALDGAKVLGCKGIIFVYSHRGESDHHKGIYFRAKMLAGSKVIWVFPNADQSGGMPIGTVKEPVLVPVKGKVDAQGKPIYKTEYKTLQPKMSSKDQQDLELSNWMFLSETTGTKADEDSAIESIASTLTSSLTQGPLSGLKEEPALPEQPMNPGIDSLISPQLPPSNLTSDGELESKISSYVAAKESANAICLAESAVDENPLDPKRRELLLRTLYTFGEAQEAIREAKSAAIAFGNSAPLLAVGSQIAFDSGEINEAESMANRALALDGKSLKAQSVLGEVALAKGDLTSQYLPLTPYSQQSALHQMWMNSVLANAMEGNSGWLIQNLGTQFGSLTVEDSARLESQLDRAYSRQSDEFKAEMGQATIDGPQQLPQLTQTLKGNAQVLEAENLVLQKLGAAFPSDKALIRKQLAFNLLLQCIEEVKAYLDAGRKGTLDDAQINFSESLRQMTLSTMASDGSDHASPSPH